jgi:hypothetical protein
MQDNSTPHTRIFWTSGKDAIEAMNRIGRDRPVCGNALTAHNFAADDDDALYCITIERFPLDSETAMQAYLETINREESTS